MAASWDPKMVEGAQTVAPVKRAQSVSTGRLPPMVDMRVTRVGDASFEGAGEDPCLGAAMAAAQVRADFQVTRIGSPEHLLALRQHFAGYGAAKRTRLRRGEYLRCRNFGTFICRPLRRQLTLVLEA